MNAHLRNAFSDWLTVAEIPQHSALQAGQNSSLGLLIDESDKPSVEDGRANKGVHGFLLYPTGYNNCKLYKVG
jgi:hypothetical protein